MTQIPRAALILGVAGLIPFVWGVATEVLPAAFDLGMRWFGPRFVGPYVGLAYGTIILAFMSGVLWGFAAQVTGRAATVGYALSVIPALWAFFFVGNGPVNAAIWLAAGFVLLLGLDYLFWRQGLAPGWWMRLRMGLTAVVVVCLSVTAFWVG
jgi:Protein of unknown function (DUF3429)